MYIFKWANFSDGFRQLRQSIFNGNPFTRYIASEKKKTNALAVNAEEI